MFLDLNEGMLFGSIDIVEFDLALVQDDVVNNLLLTYLISFSKIMKEIMVRLLGVPYQKFCI